MAKKPKETEEVSEETAEKAAPEAAPRVAMLAIDGANLYSHEMDAGDFEEEVRVMYRTDLSQPRRQAIAEQLYDLFMKLK